MVPSEFVRIPSPKQAGQHQLSRKFLFFICVASNPNCLRGTKMHFCEGRIYMESTHRRLMWHGMCLFLLGLLTGFAEPHFSNMRMGLAAHLEGLMNGIFLIALGAVWIHVEARS
jgi:hypothetical protein